MLRLLCKSVHSFGRTTTSKPHKLFILKPQQFSSSAAIATNQDSFTVQYLMNDVGFSLEKAVSASKELHLQDRDKPDAVVSFFKRQGFSDTQIRILISFRSRILYSKPEATFLPKIEFFRSKGISSSDLAKVLILEPNILIRSLKDCLIPSFKFLKTILGSDESVIHMLKVDSRVFIRIEDRVKPNIEILRGAGVPKSSIVYLLKNQSSMFNRSSDKLVESIETVEKMGMDKGSSTYLLALSVVTVTSRSKWNEKMEAYKKWGCSEDEVLKSFKILPCIMKLSIEKINRVMSFCVNEMGWESSEVVRRYFLFTLSLDKRIMPRWSVYQELVSKSLVKGDGNLGALFKMKEDLFIEKYVNHYQTEAPMLLKLYLGKLEASKVKEFGVIP